MAEYRVLKPFTYLRGDGAVVHRTKVGALIDLDDNEAQQAGKAVEPVNKQTSTSEPAPAPELAEEVEPKPRRRSHRHSNDVGEPARGGSEEGAQPVTEPDGQ